MAARVLLGLEWAKPCKNPWGRRARTSGAKARGHAFEAQVSNVGLRGGLRSLWFHFQDINGEGFCSPDLIGWWKGRPLIIECKLTDRAEAVPQLRLLYEPIVRHLLGQEARCLVIAKSITPETDRRRVVGTLEEALAFPHFETPVLHWLGKAPLVPRLDAFPPEAKKLLAL